MKHTEFLKHEHVENIIVRINNTTEQAQYIY